MARKKQDVMVVFPDLFAGTQRLTDTQFGILMRALFDYRYENKVYSGEDAVVAMAFDFAKPQIDRYVDVCNANRKNRIARNGNEVQRNATKCNEMEGNDPQIKNQNQIQSQNQCQNQSQIQNENENQIETENENQHHNQNPIQSPQSPPSEAGGLEMGLEETYDDDTNIIPYPEFMELSKYCREQGLNHIVPVEFYCHFKAKDWKDSDGNPIKDWRGMLKVWDSYAKERKALPVPEL